MTAMRPHSGFSIAPCWIRLLCWGLLAPTASIVPLNQSSAQDAPKERCRLETIETAFVTAIRDGRTLLLEDGREVRLAGLEVPLARSPGGEAARAALADLVSDRMVTLKRPGQAMQDRYGRHMIYAFTGEGGNGPSVQAALLARGHAQVAANAGDCSGALLDQERLARDAGRGLWTQTDFGPHEAARPADLSARRGHFTVIEGKILSVRESRGVIYMNFGRRWTRDFTVTLLKRNERIFTAAGLAPKTLEGRRVRVRGWIEQRSGPVVEVTRPEQIEVAGLN